MTYENAARGALEELGDMSLNDLSLLGYTEQRMLLELCHHWAQLIERRHQREAAAECGLVGPRGPAQGEQPQFPAEHAT